MNLLNSFGYWVRRQRKLLDMTQSDLAQRVSCSLSMVRKIERDERRPSEQLAELLADHLAIDDSRRQPFLDLARGKFPPGLTTSIKTITTPIKVPAKIIDTGQELAPFVARERQLKQLHEHLDLVLDGKGQMVFIAGEAGRGKTSLLREFAHQAMTIRPDLIVAGGRCDVYTGLGDPLLPFRDIFRLLAGDIDNPGMSGIIGRELTQRLARALPVTTEVILEYGPDLIDTVVPSSTLESRLTQMLANHQVSAELLARLRGLRTQRSFSATHELQQDRLFEEISSTLMSLSRHQPLLLMLDDLQWVDHSSAGLLGHLAIRLQQSPIMLIGSFRPEDLTKDRLSVAPRQQAPHPLQDVLSESQRRFGENRIDLDHPNPGEELEFVNALLDSEDNDLSQDFRKRLAQLTEGHPLFVVELLRDMKDRGHIELGSDGHWKESESISWEHFPARVEGVIEKRIGRLADDLRDLLTIGSVQGETFFAEVIAQVKQTDTHLLTRRLSGVLDRRHRLIREQGIKHTDSDRLSQYRFRHHLFQKYLYGRLSEAERMYLHEDVGNALEALFNIHADASVLPAAQLARHFEEAHLGVKASKYLLIAGQNAAQVIAFDEAAAYFERGLVLLEELTRTPEINHLEFELWLALGRARWHSGLIAESFIAAEKSIELARKLDDPEALARAVLVYEEPRWRLSLDAEPSRRYMHEALNALGEVESPLRVRLLVNLSGVLLASDEREGLRATVDQALDMARRIDDPVALCDALRISANIDRRLETTTARLSAINELITVAESIGDKERQADGLDLFVYDHLELGHIDLVDKTIETHRRLSTEISQPFQLHIAAVFQTMRAILRGDFTEAERLANEAAELSRQIGLGELDGIFGIHMFTIRAEQGRLNEIAPIVKLYVDNNPDSATWHPGLALIYATIGKYELCREVFEHLAADSFALVPRDSMWVTSIAYLTEACTFLGDAERAAILYELLLPYDGRTVVVGGATACYGAAGRYLGMLATTMTDWFAAEQHFEGALELDARMGARPWLAHTQSEYAAMLLARGEPGDFQRTIALLDESWAAAQEMGMAYLTQKISDLQEQYELDFG